MSINRNMNIYSARARAQNFATAKITAAKFGYLLSAYYLCAKFRRRENSGGEKSDNSHEVLQSRKRISVISSHARISFQ